MLGGYDPDLIGPLEARLLAVERRTVRLDDDLRQLRRGIVETQQRIWDAWNDTGSPVPIPAPRACFVGNFPAICASIPCTLQLADSYYTTTLGGGTVPLVWDGAANWHGCAIWTLPNNIACSGPVTFALHYFLTGSNTTNVWPLTMSYKTTNTTTHCPAASVCSDATNISLIKSITLTSCSGTFNNTFAASQGTAPGSQAWPASRNVTLGVTFP